MEAVSRHFIISKNKDIRESGCVKTHWGTSERRSQLGAVLGGKGPFGKLRPTDWHHHWAWRYNAACIHTVSGPIKCNQASQEVTAMDGETLATMPSTSWWTDLMLESGGSSSLFPFKYVSATEALTVRPWLTDCSLTDPVIKEGVRDQVSSSSHPPWLWETSEHLACAVKSLSSSESIRDSYFWPQGLPILLREPAKLSSLMLGSHSPRRLHPAVAVTCLSMLLIL